MLPCRRKQQLVERVYEDREIGWFNGGGSFSIHTTYMSVLLVTKTT